MASTPNRSLIDPSADRGTFNQKEFAEAIAGGLVTPFATKASVSLFKEIPARTPNYDCFPFKTLKRYLLILVKLLNSS